VVQWNGSALNILAFHAWAATLARSPGAVAAVDVKKQALVHFQTPARRLNPLKIEHQLAPSRSPRWPKELGDIDRSGASGAGLYATYCEAATPSRRGISPCRAGRNLDDAHLGDRHRSDDGRTPKP
jgi:hypothetical protein